MALSNPTYFYLTADEYAGNDETDGITTVPTLVNSLTSEQVISLLLETMAQIDGYLGGGWTPFEVDQEFIFPRCQDTDSEGNALIPRPIALATRMIADAIMLKRQKGVLPHELASESNLGHSYSRRTGGQAEFGFEHFPPEVFGLLNDPRIKRTGGQFALDDESLATC